MSKPTKEQKRTAKKRRSENHAKRVAEGHSKTISQANSSWEESSEWEKQVAGYVDKSDDERATLMSLYLLRAVLKRQSDSLKSRLKSDAGWNFCAHLTALDDRRLQMNDYNLSGYRQQSLITIATKTGLNDSKYFITLRPITMTPDLRNAIIADDDSVFIDFASGFHKDYGKPVFCDAR